MEVESEEREPLMEQQMTSSKPTKAIYAVLGFLDEYAGRYIAEDGDEVEFFYRDEAHEATRFGAYLYRLIDELELKTDLIREDIDGATLFHSAELTRLIDSYYLSNGLTGANPDGTPAYTDGRGFFRQHAGLISARVFPAGDTEAKWSFLQGAYERYGWNNAFRFANAWHKAKLIEQLLRELGSPEVVIIYSDPRRTPSVTNVAFGPTPELISRLGLLLSGFEDIHST